uniref:ATP synthase F0 subunit 8 n=1 Tax=Lasioglossum punctatissimum TaxID=1040140 RepID=A0A0S2LSI1_9HYME|nr:ATP synthase F0 subunit 8 [Lasioglossum punctatissimum]
MPQMSPMYWILLLIFTIMIMYMYISMLYFTPTIPLIPSFKKKNHKLMTKNLKFN